MRIPKLLIVSPYAAAANNGNTRTAARWARLLRPEHRVILRTTDDPLAEADVLIALHARRSHAVVRAWRDRAARGPCVLVLTGTDLYRDIPSQDPSALNSLALADHIVVLQDRGLAGLPEASRSKASVVYQSARALKPATKSSRTLRALFVGHMRPEKDPFTFLRAAAALRGRGDIALAMIGAMRDPELVGAFNDLVAHTPNVDVLGALSHAATRQHIRRAHVLVVPSRMEGGANVVVEAIVAGTPVLASDCDGNVGMLGERYPGYFPVGEPAALASLLSHCRDDPAFLAELHHARAALAPRFAPTEERCRLRAVLARCLGD